MELTPGVIDAIIIAIIVECAVLVWLMRKQWLTRFIPALVTFLLSGGAMMFALRTALADGPSTWVQGALALAGLLHIGCLWLSYWALRRAG